MKEKGIAPLFIVAIVLVVAIVVAGVVYLAMRGGSTTPLQVSASANPNSGTVPLTVYFSAVASGGSPPYTYSWSYSNMGTSSQQNPSNVYHSAGTYAAQVTVTDSAAKVASDSVTVNVASQEYSSSIVNGLISVGAGTYQAYSFTIPSGVTDAHVVGNFTASGGSGNDIIVSIMDETNFINWKNGHQSLAYYNSGQLTTSNLNVFLPLSGSFYLVFSNTFSIISTKHVQTRVDLSYTVDTA